MALPRYICGKHVPPQSFPIRILFWESVRKRDVSEQLKLLREMWQQTNTQPPDSFIKPNQTNEIIAKHQYN